MDTLLIAYIPLLLSLFLSRRMLQAAIRKLDDDLKLKLINYTTKDKSLQLGIVAAILVLFLANMKFVWLPFIFSSYLALGILMVLALFSVMRAYKKLKADGFPSWYLKDMVIGNLVRSLGLILFLIILSFL
ncbi:MAG: hypothetical protein RLZZ30_2141 [Bacteroidota bacterium]|jgi:hypothetical protein